MKTLIAFFFCALTAYAQTMTIGTCAMSSGLSDATISGAYAPAAANAQYVFTFNAVGTPDHFEWSKNGGTLSSPIAVTGAAQAFVDGLSIKFAATTGHTLNASCTVSANANGSLSGTSFVQKGVGAIVTRNAQDKLRENISVGDFGAKGDGITDDTAAFQEALNSIPNGGVLWVPMTASGYVLGPLTLNSRNVIQCASGSMFLARDNSETMFTIPGGASYTGLGAPTGGTCYIDANGKTGFTGILLGDPTVTLANQGSTIQNLNIINAATCIDTYFTFFDHIQNINCNGPTVSGFSFETSTTTMDCNNCSAIAVTGGPISAATNANPVVFTGVLGSVPHTGQQIQLTGFTGGWASANGTFTATNLSSSTFSIALDSTTFGTLSGAPVVDDNGPYCFYIHNNGTINLSGKSTCQGNVQTLVYQSNNDHLEVYYENSGFTNATPWVEVGLQNGSGTGSIDLSGSTFSGGSPYCVDAEQFTALVVHGATFSCATAAFLVDNSGLPVGQMRGWDVSGNWYNINGGGYDQTKIFAFVNRVQNQDLSNNLSADVVNPLKFTGALNNGSGMVPPPTSMQPGESTLYVDPTTGTMQNQYQSTALNDVTACGTYTGASGPHTWTVTAMTLGTPDTIQWNEDGGSYTTGVNLTGSCQTMASGVGFQAAATTGHGIWETWIVSENGGVLTIQKQNTQSVVVADCLYVANIPGGTALNSRASGSVCPEQSPTNLNIAAFGGARITNRAGTLLQVGGIVGGIYTDAIAEFPVALGGGGTQCVTADNTGAITGTGAPCAVPGITQLTGDVTAGPGSGSQVATLAASGVSAGTYGDGSHVPVMAVDAKGRTTSATNTAISPITVNASGNVAVSGSPTVAPGGSINLVGAGGATTTDTFVSSVSGTFVTTITGGPFLTSCTLTESSGTACTAAGPTGCTSSGSFLTTANLSCTSASPTGGTGSPSITTGTATFTNGLHQ